MAAPGPRLVHGTAIALAGYAALIRGAPGAGKSDLALRCLMQPATAAIPIQAVLVADDQVLAEPADGKLLLRCPTSTRGLIEVRGLGIMQMPVEEPAELALVVDLVDAAKVERLPEPELTSVIGVSVKRLALAPFEASAPLKLLLAMHDASGRMRRCGSQVA